MHLKQANKRPNRELDRLRKRIAELEALLEQYEDASVELRRLSFTDELTKLYNRRGFMTFSEKLLKISLREKTGVMITLLDVNGLKEINDTFGHLEGDRALIRTALVLREVFRESDVIARIGGDEFAVTALVTGREACRKVKRRMEELAEDYSRQSRQHYKLSFALGYAYTDGKERLSLDKLMLKADEALYAEKRRTVH